jgi:hypothetical protein
MLPDSNSPIRYFLDYTTSRNDISVRSLCQTVISLEKFYEIFINLYATLGLST